MKILRLSQNQLAKYLFFFIVVVFLVSNVFICHIYESGAVNLDHDLFNSCHAEKESLISQNESQFFAASKADQTQNDQKFALDFSSETSEKLSSLVQRKDISFIFLEDLSNSQTTKLLAVVKIE